MKYVILLGDGMGDHPIKELGGKTPLAAAKIPNMNYLAQNGAGWDMAVANLNAYIEGKALPRPEGF